MPWRRLQQTVRVGVAPHDSWRQFPSAQALIVSDLLRAYLEAREAIHLRLDSGQLEGLERIASQPDPLRCRAGSSPVAV